MEGGEQKEAPLVSIRVYIPLTEEEYNVICEMDLDTEISYYYTLEDLVMAHGLDSEWTTDELFPFVDLYAN